MLFKFPIPIIALETASAGILTSIVNIAKVWLSALPTFIIVYCMPDAEPLCSLRTADNTVFDSDGQAKLLAIDNNINGVTIVGIDSSAPRFPSMNMPIIKNMIPKERVLTDPI